MFHDILVGLKLNRVLRTGITLFPHHGKRTILSQAYRCDEVWEKRLQSPLLRNLKMDQYFVETDKKFNQKNAVSGVDIDLFANNVCDASQLEELEHLLYRFRKTKRCVEMMDSTIYAAVRTLLNFRDYESLFRLLKNQESYGIFPDHYSYNLLMDTFIKENMFKEATEVAILMMLQEDFSNEISCLLAIYSCQMLLKESLLDSLVPEPVVEEEIKNEDDNDEEEKFERVPFLRNPFFDDHFHLTKPEHLIGKTFFLAGRQISEDPVGANYQLLGLAMYEKWDKVAEIMNASLTAKDSVLISDCIEKIKKQMSSLQDENVKGQIESLITKLQQDNKIKAGELEDHLNQRMKTLSALEERDIDLQKELFKEWEQRRELSLKKQNLALEKQRRLEEIEKKKEYLFWKEKLLFFFENENKMLAEYQKALDMTVLVKSKDSEADSYVPPEIIRMATPRLTKYQRLAKVKKL